MSQFNGNKSIMEAKVKIMHLANKICQIEELCQLSGQIQASDLYGKKALPLSMCRTLGNCPRSLDFQFLTF